MAQPTDKSERAEGVTGLSLRWKTILLLVLLVVGPIGLVILLLIDVNRRAVEESERNLQASVLAEITGSTLGLVRSVRSDVDAIAASIGYAAAAANPSQEDDGMAGVRAIMATRRSISAVRFEVPDAKVSSLIRRDEKSGEDVPASTPAQRQAADDPERGVAMAALGAGRGVIVVPVPPPKDGKGVRGYVTARLDFKQLEQELDALAVERFAGHVHLLVVDGERKAIASYAVPGLASGGDASKLPVWGAMPEGTSWTVRVGVVSDHVEGEEKMIGAIESVPELGWAVAIWRPEAEAFQALTKMRGRGLAVAVGALLLALIAGVSAAGAITAPILAIVRASRLIAQRKWREIHLSSKRGDEIGELTRALGTMAGDLEAGEAEIARQAKLRGDLSRFLSKDLVSAIVEGRHKLALGGERVEITALFVDIRSYTTLTEKSTPTEVVELLNAYFGVMVSEVFRFNGTLDKFIGDAIMAVYGAPVRLADHPYQACCSALSMNRKLKEFNAGRAEQGKPPIHVGFGLSTDEVVCGNIGSNERMEYTAIGDGVNLASRLEGATKVYGVTLMISEFTYRRVESQVIARELDLLQVKGKTKPVRVYELMGLSDEPLSEDQKRLLEEYGRGIAHYGAGRFKEAFEAFEAALRAVADDPPSMLYRERCGELIKNPPGDGWDGVWRLKDK